RAERARCARSVSVGLVALAGYEAGADGDVAASASHELEEPPKLGHGMLTVRVDAPAVGVAVARRALVAGGDGGTQAAVHSEALDLGAVRQGDLGRPVGGAVVDDEHVDIGKLAPELVEHRGEVRLPVPPRAEA